MAAIIKDLIGIFGMIRHRAVARACTDFRQDPMAHPALDRMSLAQLGDIPACELRARGRV